MTDFDPELNIRARRSKRPSKGKNVGMRSPIVDHTLDDDLPFITMYAKLFDDLSEREKDTLGKYVFGGKSLDYYYGSYISAYQMYVMAFQSNNEMSLALASLVYAISSKIIRVMSEQKKIIDDSQSVDEISEKMTRL